jgi:hypothetical protein
MSIKCTGSVHEQFTKDFGDPRIEDVSHERIFNWAKSKGFHYNGDTLSDNNY